MKNITALLFLVIIISVFITNKSYCQETDEGNYRLSAGLQSGFVYGRSFEFVYPIPGQHKGKFLSELVWDIKPIYYLGIQLDYSRKDLTKAAGFFSTLSFKAGIPSVSGKTENRDWQSAENDALTDYSSHTNKNRQFFALDMSAGVTLPLNTFFYAKSFISGSWMRFAFTARDGYGKYARIKSYNTYYPIDDNPVQYSFEDFGDIIRYEQNWLLLSPGFSIVSAIFPFTFDLSFKLSLFSFCIAKDEHVLTQRTFMDYTRTGGYFEPAFNMLFSVRRFDLLFDFSYRYIGKTNGATYISDKKTDYYPASTKGGAGLSMIDARLIVRIRI